MRTLNSFLFSPGGIFNSPPLPNEPSFSLFCAAAPPGARPGGERRVASEPPGWAPGGSAEHLWLGAGGGASKKKFSVVWPYPAPALGEGRERARGEIAAASGCGHLARSRSSPAILTPRSSCGRDFSRSRDRPAPAGARLSEAVVQRTEKGPVARSATPQASAGGPPEAVCGGHFPSVFRRAPAAPWLLAVSSERLRAPPTSPDSSASRRRLRGHSG